MRTSLAFLSGALLAGIVPLALQDPLDDEPQDEPVRAAPLTDYRETEARRIAEEIDGVWLMVLFESPDSVVDQRDVRACAIFREGYGTLLFQGRVFQDSFLDRNPVKHTIQAGLHRFRVSPQLTLQTASIMGFNNANSDSELVFERQNQAREYDITLTEDELVLAKLGGNRFTFRRLEPGEFPDTAIEILERSRMGPTDPFVEDTAGGNRR